MIEETPEQSAALVKPLADRDELVERYRPLVYSIVKQVMQSFPVKVDFEELVSYGMIGLLEADERYDPRRKVSFVTFSYYRIKGAVFDGLRQMGILTRTPNDAWVRREAVLNDLTQTIADDDTETPAGIDDEILTVEKMVDSLIPAYLLSLSDENAPDVADLNALPSIAVEFEETVRIVRQTVKELPEKEAQIIEALYFRHVSTTEIARRMGVNKSWISRLHLKAINRLRQRLALIGIINT